GEMLSGDRTYRTVTSEASGRACVKLSQAGDGVEWTLAEPANALVLRACVPDTPEGTGLQTCLALYTDDVRLDDVQLSSR
ncbi:MAG TPA: hypothetical protein PKE04_04655, partial [Clostridia bacterium]|nr:hypothetical protein [Clostridia bacterium]